MGFRITSQYIDSAGKLRIIYGHFNSQKVTLLTFPSAPLDKVPLEADPKIELFRGALTGHFIKTFQDELQSDGVEQSSTGLWFTNTVFPPAVCLPYPPDLSRPAPSLPFPLMVEVSQEKSNLDEYKARMHKANIFKQYALFLYASAPQKYSLAHSFVVNDRPNYEFDKWTPPNWLSLQNKKMFLLEEDEKKGETSIRLIVPGEEFKERLDFYVQKELQRDKDRVLAQKHRETIPNFYNYKSNFKKHPDTLLFSSASGVQEWFRYKTTSKEYLPHFVAPSFRPSKTDLVRLGAFAHGADEKAGAESEENPELGFTKQLLEPYFFSHYKITNRNVALVQNVLGDRQTFADNLFQALVVSRIWVLEEVNRASERDFASFDLKWGGVSAQDLEKEIAQKEKGEIFKDYRVDVYSPTGERIHASDLSPQAHLIHYKGGYAALLFVSFGTRS